jgi:pyrroloquinoline quinone biosynthesis protein B
MKAIVLGSAAGGGYPQWNCGCSVCSLFWQGDKRVRRRTQSSLAISDGGQRWALLNCSPDIREQITATPGLWPNAGITPSAPSFSRTRESRLSASEHVESLDSRVRGNDGAGDLIRPRHSPITDVVLTNADIDHIAGLLTLREMHPLTIWTSEKVQAHLQANNVFSVLNASVVTFRTLELGEPFQLFNAITVQAFDVPGKVPLYQEATAGHGVSRNGNTVGLHLDHAGKRLSYVPGCGDIDAELLSDLDKTDALCFDGTLWRDDEMLTSGAGQKTGRRMGHVPIVDTIKGLETLPAKQRYFVHMNNTNPVLIDASPERLAVEAANWVVSHDGLEIAL